MSIKLQYNRIEIRIANIEIKEDKSHDDEWDHYIEFKKDIKIKKKQW